MGSHERSADSDVPRDAGAAPRSAGRRPPENADSPRSDDHPRHDDRARPREDASQGDDSSLRRDDDSPREGGEADDTDHAEASPLVLTCDTAGAAITSWFFAGACALGACYGAYAMTRGSPDWSRDGPILAVFVYVFPAVATLFVLGSVLATLRWRRQGVTRLRIPRGFVVEGGQLSGTVECSRSLDAIGPATATLECIESRTVRRGGKSQTRTRQVWSERTPLEPAACAITARGRAASGGGACFSLRVRVPELQRAPDPSPGRPGEVAADAFLRWRLTVAIPTQGLDHESCFDVPILSKDELHDVDDARED